MILTLQEILFKYFLKNNLDVQLSQFKFLNNQYLYWKQKYYTNCSCCNKLIKKKNLCQICQKYYFCDLCWDDYTYFCFYCDKHHCFICNVKRKSCYKCYR